MLTVQQMQEIQTFLLRELPSRLMQEREFTEFLDQSIGEREWEGFPRLVEDVAAFRLEVNHRFDRVEGRLESLYTRMEGAEHRLDEFDLQMRYARRDIARNGSQLSYLIRRMDGLEAWIKAIEGGKGSEKGQNLEETFATALRFGLNRPDLKPENIHLHVKLTDLEGLIYKPGYSTEVDIIIQGNHWTVFEIKASAEKDDVTSFWFKLKLIRLQQPDKEIRGVIFSCRDDAELKGCCRDYQIELIEPFTTLTKYEMEEEALPPDLADLPPENDLPEVPPTKK